MAELENSKDLISVLWSGADILRSKMDANEYKDYLLGIVFYLLSFILWMFILQLFNLTYISPVAYGITYIFIMIFSFIFLNERISKEQIIGVFLIIIGILIASIKKTE